MRQRIREHVGNYSTSAEASKAAHAYEDRTWGYFGRAEVVEVKADNGEPVFQVWGVRSNSCD